MDKFIDITYVMSFAGMVIIAVLLTQFVKNLFAKVKTKYVVLAIAFLLCLVAAIFYGNFATLQEIVETVITWLINIVIVWFSAMKSFETIKGG